MTEDEMKVFDFLCSKMTKKERTNFFEQKAKEEIRILKFLGVIKDSKC